MKGGKFIIILGGQQTGIALSNATFPANSAQGAAIGNLSVIGGGSEVFTFTLTDTAGGIAQVAGTNGVNLQAGAAAATAGSYSITVHAVGSVGTVFNKTFLITAVTPPTNGPMDFSVPGNIAITAAIP